MAEKRLTLNEVMDGLDGSDFEDDSEDDFDGYFDMDSYNDESDLHEERDDKELVESGEPELEENVGANVEIDADGGMDPRDGADLVPDYTLQAGCSASVDGESPLDFLSLLITDDMLEHIVAQTNLSAHSSLIPMNLLHTHVSASGPREYMMWMSSVGF